MKKMVAVMMVALIISLLQAGTVSGEYCGKRVIYLDARSSMELLTTPNYPNDYENNEHCQWVLSAMQPNHVVQMEAVSTDLINWDGGDCEDYIAVYDGLDRTKPLLKKWCSAEKAVVKSSGKSMLVVFHTDSHLTGKGFALKYYSMEQYSSKCDPDRVVALETSFNPIYVDLPNYSTMTDKSLQRVQCRYLFTSNREDASQSLQLDLHSAMKCSDGNFTLYDGPDDTSPIILSWCYTSKPFEVINTRQPQALLTFTLLRPDMNWHVLRVRAVARSRSTGCRDSNIPTLQVSSLATFVSFPYTTSVQEASACSLRFWAEGRYQTLRLDIVRPSKTALQCGDQGINFVDGYSQFSGGKVIGQACKLSTVYSSTHHLLVSPGKDFPINSAVVLRVVAVDYPCNNNTEERNADSDHIETLPSLASNSSGYPNDAQCRYLLSASRRSDSVTVEVEGRMVPRGASACEGDYIVFYDGDSTSDPVLGRWCGAFNRRSTFTSSRSKLLVMVTSDQHDNQYDGFSLKYYSVPASGRCKQQTRLSVNSTQQNLTSPNYPFYYPINSYCEWLLTAKEGEVVVVKVVKSDMEGDCSDMVRVYDGKEKSLEKSLGRWCASETPEFMSTGRYLLLIFTADDRWNTGGFELQYYIHSNEAVSRASVWAIVGGLLAAIIIIIIVVIGVVLYLQHWRREQHKI